MAMRPKVVKKNHHQSKDFLTLILKALFALSLFSCFSILFYFSWQKINVSNVFPIKHFKIISDGQKVKLDVLRQVVQNQFKGDFFSGNLHSLKKILLVMPWVASVSLRREWPDTLKISIHEEKALANWRNKALINRRGKIYWPPVQSFPIGLPILSGPSIAFHEKILNKYDELTSYLVGKPLFITRLELTHNGVWMLVLNNRIKIILGQKLVDERFIEFVNIFPTIIGKNESRMLKVDLRYAHGFAIKWQ